MNHFKLNVAVCFCLLFATQCIPTGGGGGGTPAPAATYREIIDTSYGVDAKQKMDIYLPEGRTMASTKTLILIHGGGWQTGDKSEQTYKNIINRIKVTNPNVAIVNMNYRLVSGNGDPQLSDLMDDVHSAITFLKSNASTFKISNRFALWGFSAGAHLATLYAYAYNTNNDVKVVSDWCGPTDFTGTNPNDFTLQLIVTGKNTYMLQRDLLGGVERSDNPTLWSNASPLSHVTASTKPTIIIHHSSDPVVPYYNSSFLNTELNNVGVPHSLIDARSIVNQESYKVFGFYMPDINNVSHDFTDPNGYPIAVDSRITDGVRNYTVDTTLGFFNRFL
ncbi:MAG: alpha/beta hydrolase [Chitinophagales bacterium]